MTDLSPRGAGPSRRHTALLLSGLVLVAAALYMLGLRWGVFAQEPTWAYDEILPRHVLHRWPLLYPPAHSFVLRLVYTLAAWLGLAEFPGHGGLGPVIAWMLASRLTTVVLACATLVLFYRVARHLLSRAASLFAVGCVAFGTNYVYYAKTANLDVPYVFWFSAALLFFYKGLAKARTRYLVLFAISAALATATKDQAGGLFLLAPFALVVARGRRLGLSTWRAAFAPGPLIAALAGAATYLLVFALADDGLAEHVAALRSLPYEHYRTYELSPGGLLRMAGLTLRNLAFVSGVPVLLAAVAGLGLALRRPRHDAGLLAGLLFAVPYWILFICLSGFDYDRHYLPLSLVLALFAARALEALPRPATRHFAAAAILFYLALRGLSVDLMLRGDARYAAADWLVDNDMLGDTLGLGEAQLLPAAIGRVSMARFAPRRTGEHGYNDDVWHNCLVLASLDVRYIVPERPELFTTPGLNYRERKRFRNTAPFSVVDFESLPFYYSNVVKPARDVVIFERTADRCVDFDPAAVALEELRGVTDRVPFERLARAVFEDGDLRSIAVGLGDIRLLRTGPQRTTLGDMPAGIAIRNRGFAPRRVETWIEIEGGDEFPVTVTVNDGENTQRLAFSAAGMQRLRLAPVPANGYRLFVVTADRAWREPGGKLRGARLYFYPAAQEAARWRAEFGRVLRGLTEERDPSLRAALRQAVSGETLGIGVGEIEGAKTAGLTAKGWTRETAPAALLVTNERGNARTAVLNLASRRRPEHEMVLVVDDGDKVARHPLPGGVVSRLPLGTVEAASERLFILWTEGEPVAGDAPQGLAVRLRSVELRRLRASDKTLETSGDGH